MYTEYRERLTVPQTTDYGAVCSLCAALRARYSRLLRPVVAGASLLGRPLPGLVLTPPGSAGRPLQRVLLAGAFHGQEWLTALCGLRLFEDLCRALDSGLPLCGIAAGEALRDRQLWLLPMVNPDGVEIALRGSAAAGEYAAFAAGAGGDQPGLWQANARGVDINHNFNAGWAEMQEQAAALGRDRTGARQYPGPAPESEPETRAVTDLCRQYGFQRLIALHSQGEEIYWEYGEDTPPESPLIARILAEAGGYTAASPTGMAVHGGAKDWFIRCFHRPGFTIELGRGTNPLPVTQFEAIYGKAREMLVLAMLL